MPARAWRLLWTSETADPFTVTLETGTYTAQCYSVISRETKGDGKITVPSKGSISFTPLFAEAGPVVLYLKRVGR